MKKNSEYARLLFIGFCCLLAVIFFPLFKFHKALLGIDDLSSLYVYSLSKNSLKNFKIVGISIDENSLNNIPQRWPWKRSVYARLIKILDKEKVNTVGVDFTFVGEAEDKEDDRILKEALSASSSRVVLAYFFDYKKAVPVLPASELMESAYSIGMVNTPQDADGRVRRLRSHIKLENSAYYSFPVQIAASFLEQEPQRIISAIPLLKDSTFYINYLIKPKDIIKVSFYDVLENLDRLKKQYGDSFLSGAVVLVYPEAGIFHDFQQTPLGEMPGGFLHFNGVADILSKRFLREGNYLLIPFLILSFALIFCIFLYSNFLIGFLFMLGVIFVNFWFFMLFNLAGLKFDYSRIVLFCAIFFTSGSIYKYLHFLTELLRIKNKATLDPLTNLFTMRYFYYRLELELKKIFFNKALFLIFIHTGSFKKESEEVSLDRTKYIWQQISSLISLKNSFWAAYTQEGLAGFLVTSQSKIGSTVHYLRNSLQALLLENNIKSNLKSGYLRLKKDYPARELIFVVADELKKRQEEVVLFSESDLAGRVSPAYSKTKEEGRLLESIDEDIEDKNKNLLSLVEELKREHIKIKEAFFQIITSLVNALEARDPYTQGHSQRVCSYSLIIADKLNWTKEEKDKLAKAALLHDLGKIGIPDSILHKKSALTDEEFDFMKKHELIATKILEPMKDFSEILPWIMYHHEKWNGKGYPYGLSENAIPEASQIISLADVYDALTTGRDYKKAFSPSEALEMIIKDKGLAFNPSLTDIFVNAMRLP